MVHAMTDGFDPRTVIDTVIVVGIVAVAGIGFVAGLKELIIDVSKLPRAKV